MRAKYSFFPNSQASRFPIWAEHSYETATELLAEIATEGSASEENLERLYKSWNAFSRPGDRLWHTNADPFRFTRNPPSELECYLRHESEMARLDASEGSGDSELQIFEQQIDEEFGLALHLKFTKGGREVVGWLQVEAADPCNPESDVLVQLDTADNKRMLLAMDLDQVSVLVEPWFEEPLQEFVDLIKSGAVRAACANCSEVQAPGNGAYA